MKCKLYGDLRDELFLNISDIYNIDGLTSQDLFIFIMCASDFDSLAPIIRYITSAFDMRVDKVK